MVAMKTKLTIKIPSTNILKETPEQRKDRVTSAGSAMFTRIVPDKKKFDKKKQRQQDKKEISTQL